MSKMPGCVAGAAAILLAGCATGNGEVPLMFGSTNVIGVSIGGNVADTGGEFVVGYKGLDVAVIPVSAVQSGTEKFLGATGGKHVDSYSVIGQFSADAGKSGDGANAGLGKFFATGMAARTIASGFAKKMGAYGRTSVAECKSGPAAAPPAAAGGTETASATDRRSIDISPASAVPAGAVRPGARLIFAQYDYKALAIDGSALESGVKLTLGYRNRNIALIPMIGRDANGDLVWLESHNPGGSDVLSVLGQFKSDDSIRPEASGGQVAVKTTDDGMGGSAPKLRGISSGLEKFFSTGGAAATLASGFSTKLCEEYAVSFGQQAPAQQAPGGSNQQKTAAPSAQPAGLVEPGR